MACSACERRRQKIRELAEKAKQKLFPKKPATEQNSSIPAHPEKK